jgi:hypothetical protein
MKWGFPSTLLILLQATPPTLNPFLLGPGSLLRNNDGWLFNFIFSASDTTSFYRTTPKIEAGQD